MGLRSLVGRVEKKAFFTLFFRDASTRGKVMGFVKNSTHPTRLAFFTSALQIDILP
jgi:hypothetical protein